MNQQVTICTTSESDQRSVPFAVWKVTYICTHIAALHEDWSNIAFGYGLVAAARWLFANLGEEADCPTRDKHPAANVA